MITQKSERRDPVAINLTRMQRGEPVGDDCLYGQRCHDLISAGLDSTTLRKYRSGFYFSLKDTYGKDLAVKMENECIQRHEKLAALKVTIQGDYHDNF